MKKIFLPFAFLALFAFTGCQQPEDDGVDYSEEIVEVDEDGGEELPLPGVDDFGGTTGGEFLDFDSEVGAGITQNAPKFVSPFVLATINEEADNTLLAQAQQTRARIRRVPVQIPVQQPYIQPEFVGRVPARLPHQPRLFANLPDYLHNPDGLTVSDDQKTVFMCCPNFNGRENNEGPKKNGGFLVSFDIPYRDGTLNKLLEFPVLEETGQTGCMGLDFGPDGHLYVCDNQYFFNKDHKSRVLRVLMDGKKATGEVQVVATGLKLANAIMWMEDKMLVSDTALDLEGKFGAGGIWSFTKDEALEAGTGDNPAIALQPNGTDPRLVIIEEVDDVGRHDGSGVDGITCTPDGTVYFGNFGDGAMYRAVFENPGKATVEKIHNGGEVFECCDGIFYDKRTDKVYINDSQANAIRAFKPVNAGEKPNFELIWQNGDTDGAGGLLDQPCECVVIGRYMIICNFDWPFPGLLNSNFDAPYTMSVITLE